jgi:CheY-like chemotaxis protein
MIDPASMMFIAITFAASKVAHKAADRTIESAWIWAKGRLRSFRGAEPTPATVTPEVMKEAFAGDPAGQSHVSAIYARSGALRRAVSHRNLLDAARVLWIDDHPENNSWERRSLEAFGVVFVTVQTTPSALAVLARERFDVIISDIGRDSGPSGLAALPGLQAAIPRVPVIFYVGDLTPGTPAGAFGIANDPEELLHLLMDVLARIRS